MTEPRTVVAAFDFDGTLTTRDCVVPFLVRVGGRRGIVGALLRRPIASIAALARRDRDALKEIVVGGVLRGRRVADVDAIGETFAAHVIRTVLRDDVVQRLRWHQRSGHRAVVVSASLGPYLRPMTIALGIDACLCTDVIALDGCYADRLSGGNCRGAVKAERLRQWLRTTRASEATLWAYGDSLGDREMLAMADHPLDVHDLVLDPVPEGDPPC